MNENAKRLAALLIRNFNDAELQRETREPLYDDQGARLARGTAAKKLGASIDILPPGKRGCPYHLHHAQEEMFIVIDGQGSLRVAGEMLPITTGDTVFIPAGPEYPHQIINTSDAPLRYLSISTMQSPEICEYPDSNKHGVWVDRGDTAVFEARHRSGGDLDYWDGEP